LKEHVAVALSVVALIVALAKCLWLRVDPGGWYQDGFMKYLGYFGIFFIFF
jgi:hypothetical protein